MVIVNIGDYLKIKAAAAFLGVSVNTLRNWERAGKLATYRHPINGYRLYKKRILRRCSRRSSAPTNSSRSNSDFLFLLCLVPQAWLTAVCEAKAFLDLSLAYLHKDLCFTK